MFYFVNFIEVKSKNAVVWDFKPRLGQASLYNILRDFTLSKKATQFAGGRINLRFCAVFSLCGEPALNLL